MEQRPRSTTRTIVEWLPIIWFFVGGGLVLLTGKIIAPAPMWVAITILFTWLIVFMGTVLYNNHFQSDRVAKRRKLRTEVLKNLACCKYEWSNPVIHGISEIYELELTERTDVNEYMLTIHSTRLGKLNAIVFLSLKTKGRGKRGFTQLSHEEFAELTNMCLNANIPFGFDSCGAQKFLKSLDGVDTIRRKVLEMSAEPCESSLFSTYIDVFGVFHPCSFSPNTDAWGKEGLDVLSCNDFINDIWNHEKTKQFRETLLKGHRNCPLYTI